MKKLILALFLFNIVFSAPVAGIYQVRNDKDLICRSDHYGIFLVQKTSTNTYKHVKFSAVILKINKDIASLVYKNKRTKVKSIINKNKGLISKYKNVIKELTACRDDKVSWGVKIANTNVCTVIGGANFTVNNAIIAGERCIEAQAPTARIYTFYSKGAGLCSGTLITPNIVITAAHCVEEVQSARIFINLKERGVKKFIYKPGFSSKSNGFEEEDIGLYYLTENVTDVTPAEIYSGGLLKNESVIIGGYGLDEFGVSGYLKAGYMFIDSSSSNAIYAKFLGRYSNTCSGDSGGPLYVNRDGKWKLAGLTSNGQSNTCSNPDYSGFARLAGSNLDFINDNLE